MAIINNIEQDGTVINPITASQLVYNSSGKSVHSIIGSTSVVDVSNVIYNEDSDVLNMNEELEKIGDLISSLNSKGLSISDNSTSDDISTSIENAVSTSYPLCVIDKVVLLPIYTTMSVTTIDVKNMSESDRTELGTLLGITITANTELYLY